MLVVFKCRRKYGDLFLDGIYLLEICFIVQNQNLVVKLRIWDCVEFTIEIWCPPGTVPQCPEFTIGTWCPFRTILTISVNL